MGGRRVSVHRLWRDALVSSATGLARETIRKGRREISQGEAPTDRVRRPGAGRPRLKQTQPGLLAALEGLVDPLTRGDPTSPLRWTCKSRAKLAAVLAQQGWRVSSTTVGRMLHQLGYRLQSVRKRQEGASHPDRNAQFEYINATADAFLADGQPVISVDTKKKEMVGNFKNGGREWQPKGTPAAVLVHDFPSDAEGNAMGCGAYPDATALFITADSGGCHGYRYRAWKHELQQLPDETGLTIQVSHFPPGTSKWNKISSTASGTPGRATGLRVLAELDAGQYPTGVKVTQEQMDAIALVREAFHGEWNYKLLPRSS